MLTIAEEDQIARERISDALINNDDYFMLSNPVKFLDWAVGQAPFWTDVDEDGYPEIDYDGMFSHWLSEVN
jgi:hypothetical protein